MRRLPLSLIHKLWKFYFHTPLKGNHLTLQGRMAMVDVLCDMKERAMKEINPHIMTIATLTGHAKLSYGPYTIVMDNGPAKREAFAQGLQVIS